MNLRNGFLGLTGLALLAACGQQDVVLPGDRLDIRAISGQAAAVPENRSRAVNLARATNYSTWSHRAGSASHKIQHAAFSTSPAPLWASPIGQGTDRKHRITADPVAADGRIFTLDSRALVSATTTSGATLWTRDLTPAGDKSDDASGGGLAVVGGKLYVTTGFGALTALDVADGSLIWQQQLDAPATGAPTVSDGVVYVATRDSRAWSIDAGDGRVRWQLGATPSVSGVVAGAGPAVSKKFVVFPFSSGQMAAAFQKGGLQVWRSSVLGSRPGQAYARLSDISGDPLISGGVVYAGNPSGRTVALDLATGEEKWRANEGATGPIWLEGRDLYLVSDQAELVRLDARSGDRIWGVDLPSFVPVRNARRQRDVYANFGPVLAGGLLWVASGDGQLRGFNPADGVQRNATPLGQGAATRPIVVDGVLYVVDTKGQLLAFR